MSRGASIGALAATVVAMALLMALPAGALADFGFVPGADRVQRGAARRRASRRPSPAPIPTSFVADLNLNKSGGGSPEGSLRDLSIDLPAGMIENPTTVPILRARRVRHRAGLSFRNERLRRELLAAWPRWGSSPCEALVAAARRAPRRLQLRPARRRDLRARLRSLGGSRSSSPRTCAKRTANTASPSTSTTSRAAPASPVCASRSGGLPGPRSTTTSGATA